jgi:hypothetical protein
MTDEAYQRIVEELKQRKTLGSVEDELSTHLNAARWRKLGRASARAFISLIAGHARVPLGLVEVPCPVAAARARAIEARLAALPEWQDTFAFEQAAYKTWRDLQAGRLTDVDHALARVDAELHHAEAAA